MHPYIFYQIVHDNNQDEVIRRKYNKICVASALEKICYFGINFEFNLSGEKTYNLNEAFILTNKLSHKNFFLRKKISLSALY